MSPIFPNKEDQKKFDNFFDSGRIKKDSKTHIYFLAWIAGIILAFILIFGVQLAITLVKATWGFLKIYWIWVIIGIIILFLFKKLLSKKRVEVHKEYPEGYRYPG